MIYAFCDAAWRVVLLLVLGFTPYAAPVDATEARGIGGALGRLIAFGVVALGLTLIVRKTRLRDPIVAIATAAALVGAVLLSIVFAGDDGPLARGAWLMAPLVWAMIAALATAPVARALGRGERQEQDVAERRKIRIGMFVLAAVAAVASLAAARARLSPREHLWEQALAADAGNESAALAVAAQARAHGDRKASYAPLAACAAANPRACRCAEAAAIDAIDLGRYVDARARLEASASCKTSPARSGTWAEALVGTNETAAGIAEADKVLAASPSEPHALFARAWGMMLTSDPNARAYAERAAQAGRGVPAELLLGLLMFRANDLDGAKSQFDSVVRRDPTNVQATYDLALVAHQKNQYHDAREGYLRALKLDPSYADARYNLVLLTHAHGANAEAQHHLVELSLLTPNDARLPQLRQLVGLP